MAQTVAIALSGGIDSLVAAALLKEKGLPLMGLHFLTGYDALTIKANGAKPPRIILLLMPLIQSATVSALWPINWVSLYILSTCAKNLKVLL
jgi:NH3-dependent NAD+ synthetase